jgi:hypothetical protein
LRIDGDAWGRPEGVGGAAGDGGATRDTAAGTGTAVAATAPRATTRTTAAVSTAARARAAVAAAAGTGATVAAPSTWTARAAGFTFTRLADRQRTSHEQLAVEATNRLLGRAALGVFHKGESARTPGLSVEGANNLGRLTDLRKMGTQIVFGGLVGQVTDEQSY